MKPITPSVRDDSMTFLLFGTFLTLVSASGIHKNQGDRTSATHNILLPSLKTRSFIFGMNFARAPHFTISTGAGARSHKQIHQRG
jgi:hypothetical protein